LGVGVFRAVFGFTLFCGLLYFVALGWADLREDGLLDLEDLEGFEDLDEPPLLPPPPLPPLAIAELRPKQKTIVIARMIIVRFMKYSLFIWLIKLRIGLRDRLIIGGVTLAGLKLKNSTINQSRRLRHSALINPK